MRDDPSVVTLVTRARGNDPEAWNELIERYAPLVWAICVRYRLSSHDTEDVSQSIWLLLAEHLGKLREPAALPGWLATTTRNECLRVLRLAGRFDLPGQLPDDAQDPGIEEEIMIAERNAALRAAFDALPVPCQRLLALLITDPPVSYADISAELGIAVGSIGPSRARCLERVRRHPAVAALINADPADGGDPSEQPVGR